MSESKVGPGLAGDMRIGLWIDDRPETVLTDVYRADLKSLKIAVAAIMVDGNVLPDPKGPQWRPSWTKQQLVDVSHAFEGLGIQLILTCWPVPVKAYIHTICTEMGRLIQATGAAGFEVDTEGLWTAANVAPDDFASLAEAGTYLAAAMRQAAPDASLQLTTYPYHSELSKDNTVSRYMDVAVPQAYSTDPGADGKPGRVGRPARSWQDAGPRDHQSAHDEV
jgi:hypothetical protein